MTSASLLKMEPFARVGLVDVSTIMTALTLDRCATKEDAHKDLEDQMEDLLDLVDLLREDLGDLVDQVDLLDQVDRDRASTALNFDILHMHIGTFNLQ